MPTLSQPVVAAGAPVLPNPVGFGPVAQDAAPLPAMAAFARAVEQLHPWVAPANPAPTLPLCLPAATPATPPAAAPDHGPNAAPEPTGTRPARRVGVRSGLGRLTLASQRTLEKLGLAAPVEVDLTVEQDVRRPFRRPMTVLVANPKGGSGKTAITLLMAGTLGSIRGGNVLAWDNHDARGGLVDRANPRGAPDADGRTVRDLLVELETFESHAAGIGELAGYLRPQDESFDVLASDEDPGSMLQISAEDFLRLHAVLRRHYRLLVIESGNNARSDAWQAALSMADCLVLASTYEPDSVAAASWTLDHVAAVGREDLLGRCVTVLTAASGRPDPARRTAALTAFAQTAAVVELPHEKALRGGERIKRASMSQPTITAMTKAVYAVFEQLHAAERPSEPAGSADLRSAHGLGRSRPELAHRIRVSQHLDLLPHGDVAAGGPKLPTAATGPMLPATGAMLPATGPKPPGTPVAPVEQVPVQAGVESRRGPWEMRQTEVSLEARSRGGS
ncbi:MAG TPA: hypothetical protein VHV82_11115 [Sporichthyaceae bacterium]|jgi:MinD-like ATPase involved in chromosome partitioning or flagellar assembly|nr:hypothetical protein [Sporichthyaceae bacterium]